MPSNRAAILTAVAHQVSVALLDHVAKVNSDPKLDPPLRWYASIALDHAVLDLNSAADRIDNASELDENAVSGPLEDPAVMQSDGRVDEIAAEGAQSGKRPLLVDSGELAVSGHCLPQGWHASLRVSAMAAPFNTKKSSTAPGPMRRQHSRVRESDPIAAAR
jgi:hypothetical protein